jgi:uncharacterized membrane protein YozB (DUF420 family)
MNVAVRPDITRVLLALGLLSSATAWFLIAPPVITFSSVAKHEGHFALAYVHVLGGTVMLFLGLANLYIGITRRHFAKHRLLGRLYLFAGGLGVLAAVLITSSPAHKLPGSETFTNTSVSLLTLATAWLLATGMAWRAVRNRRIDAHRQWMIRSYVLAWSFVFCRLVSRVPGVDEFGGSAFIWLSWVGPLIVCEVALQWSAGADRDA